VSFGTNRRGDAIAVAIIVLILTALFFDVLFLGRSLFRRDLTRYYYPTKHVLHDIVARGDFPLWNPVNSAGQPAAANPEYEVFYPGQWLIFLPSFDLGYRLHIMLHFYLAALGMYALMRSLGVRAAASCATSLAFTIGGPLLSLSNLLPAFFAMAWLPVILLFAWRFVRAGAWYDFAVAALLLGIQLLILDPAVVVETWTLIGGYALYRWRRAGMSFRSAAVALALVPTGLLAGAVQVLPTLDHAHDSVRASGLSFAMISYWSMPATRVAELILPHFQSAYAHGEQGSFLYSLYPGYAVIVALLAGLALGDGRIVAATVAGVLTWIMALGDTTPLLRLAFDAHLVPAIRFPERFAMMSVFLLTLAAGLALDRIVAERRARRIAVIAAAVLCLPAALEPPMLLRALALLLIVLAAWRLPERVVAFLIVAFVIADLAPLAPALTPRIERRYFTERPRVLDELAPDRDSYRVFHQAEWHDMSPTAQRYFSGRAKYWNIRNGLMPRVTSQWGVRTVFERDVDQTVLAVTDDLLDAMWQVRAVRPDWAGIFAAMSNVHYTSAYRPYDAEVARNGDLRTLEPIVFIPIGDNPRAYFADEIVPVKTKEDFVHHVRSEMHSRRVAYAELRPFHPAGGRILRFFERTNDSAIDVDASGPAFLVIANTWHKYWRASLDGRPVPVIRTNLAYQGIVVPAGKHAIVLRYRNPLIVIGAVISALTVIALLTIAFISVSSAPPAGSSPAGYPMPP
jgi:hypothetical protein